MGKITTKYRIDLPVSNPTQELVQYIERLGGINVHDSRHERQVSQDGCPLAGGLIYEFPYNKGLMIQLNANLPSIYVKSILPDGKHLFDCLPEIKPFHKEGKIYTINRKGQSKRGYHAALDHEEWLAPSQENPVVLLSLIEVNLAKKVVDLICGNSQKLISECDAFRKNQTIKKSKPTLSAAQLIERLEKQSETGILGEKIAYQYEYVRLIGLGMKPAEAEKAITHIALDNVAQGYDIESHHNGESRYIEVKTTTAKAESDFFFSLNEYETLKQKGNEAFIYRVILAEKDEDSQVIEIQNPFGSCDKSKFDAVAFKANLSDFD
ncbi:DUF3883 domain-containing protein [Acinetobacter brisouii]|uniref:DUF3883 domain-containing protein n=1 Tax=Acinetobacter brisouii TaxID=396323 RepID=UPI0035AE5928